VINRCFQITPEENHETIWLNTSTGLEKKNGGSHIFPNTGTLAKNCHSASATIATNNCKERSPILDMLKPLSLLRYAYGLENVPTTPVAPLA
jgi:hypothetical protein